MSTHKGQLSTTVISAIFKRKEKTSSLKQVMHISCLLLEPIKTMLWMWLHLHPLQGLTSVWIESQLLGASPDASHTHTVSHLQTQDFSWSKPVQPWHLWHNRWHFEQYAQNNIFETKKNTKHTSSIDKDLGCCDFSTNAAGNLPNSKMISHYSQVLKVVLSLQSNSMRARLSSRNSSKSLQALWSTPGGSPVSTIPVCNKTPCITKKRKKKQVHVLSDWETKI